MTIFKCFVIVLITFFRRSVQSMYLHWSHVLKPILLSYHAEELHFDWKIPFFKRVIKKKIFSIQDIDWPEFQSKFPTQTTKSMTMCLVHALQRKESEQPLYKRLIEILPNLKHIKERPSVANYREKIVFLYDKVRGVTK